jgi:hypothetical protein
MFSLLLLPPVCGLCLFLGLLTATRGPLVRLLLTLVLTGLVAPVIGVAMHNFLHELPVEFVLGSTALLLAFLICRVVPVLPVPSGNTRGLCWALVLVSCTLTTVMLTAPAVAHGMELALVVRLLVVALGLAGAHVATSLFTRRALAPKRNATPVAQPRPRPTSATPTLLSRPLELVGADAPYYPLASGFTAGAGPAAAFSAN